MVFAAGLFIFLSFVLLFGLSSVISQQGKAVPVEGVLVLDLGMEIYDRPAVADPVEELLAELGGGRVPRMSLTDVLTALENAKSDSRISAILVTGGFIQSGSMANSLATLTELREKLIEVRAAGKKIFAYTHSDGLGEFYIKSVATEWWMDPFGTLDYRGLAAQMAYLGGALENIGVEVQIIRAGDYKSFGESFVRETMSDEAREAFETELADLWLTIREGLEAETDLSLEGLDVMANTRPLIDAESARAIGLVDDLLYYDEMRETLIAVAGMDPTGETFKQVALSQYTMSLDGGALGRSGTPEDGSIAVVYAEGTIVDGKGDETTIGGDHYAQLIRELRLDPAVDAIVLRVNSPGGSASASEMIAREVELANELKPVVVSMGGYAASGGYYISAQARSIFAQETTVTGSIGVVAMIPSLEEMTGKLAIQFETVATNRHGTLWSIMEKKTDEQIGIFQEWISTTYDIFLARVSEGRNMTPLAAHEVAQGRVWTGVRAQTIGLVDHIGGLEDAVVFAAEEAALGTKFEIIEYPYPQSMTEVLFESLGSAQVGLKERFGLGQLDKEIAPLFDQWRLLLESSDPRHLYSYLPSRISW